MRYPCTILMLVAMLTTTACPRIPFKFEVLFIVIDELSNRWFGDADSYSARVYASSAFSWRNPLNAVATSFVVEFCEIIARYSDRNVAVTVVGEVIDSAFAIAVADVCFSQVCGKQFGILATLGPANLNNTFHDISCWVLHC
jgi:hypothetical protein